MANEEKKVETMENTEEKKNDPIEIVVDENKPSVMKKVLTGVGIGVGMIVSVAVGFLLGRHNGDDDESESEDKTNNE